MLRANPIEKGRTCLLHSGLRRKQSVKFRNRMQNGQEDISREIKYFQSKSCPIVRNRKLGSIPGERKGVAVSCSTDYLQGYLRECRLAGIATLSPPYHFSFHDFSGLIRIKAPGGPSSQLIQKKNAIAFRASNRSNRDGISLGGPQDKDRPRHLLLYGTSVRKGKEPPASIPGPFQEKGGHEEKKSSKHRFSQRRLLCIAAASFYDFLMVVRLFILSSGTGSIPPLT